MSDRKPRILLGVTADISLRLMQGFPSYLVENGWDVHLVSSPGPALAALGASHEVTVHPLLMARNPAPLRDLVALIRWQRLLVRVRPDVMSVGTPKAGLLGGIAGLLARVPVRVYMLRGLRLETTTGVMRVVLAALERLTMTCAHTVLSVSESLRTLAINVGLVRPSKICVLGAGSSNGVDLKRFDRALLTDAERDRLRATCGIVPGVPVVGFVGRLTEDKGLSVLGQARAILEREGVDYQLLLVGGIDDARTQQSLDQLRLSGRPIIETGHVENTATFYQIIDVLCLPTLREGFPNVVLEAASTSVPTVTTNATGAIDSVVDAETGLIAATGSAIALAGCLATLIKDAEMRHRLGESARRMVVERYDKAHVWKRTEEFYTSRLRSVPNRSMA